MRWTGCFLIIGIANLLYAQEPAPPRWPQFRGVSGQAVAADAKPLPIEFGPAKNVRWKTPLPAGWSSPCIWGKRIFLTGFDSRAQKLETLCLERSSGKLLWRNIAPADKIERVYKVNSPASATPATDGSRVVVSFGSYGLLCYDMDGKELWRRPLP
jgi:outer membrane protein assembly factor BamB